MRARWLVLTLSSSAIACGSGPDAAPVRLQGGEIVQPGEAGKLVEIADSNHYIADFTVSSNYLYVAVPWAGVYRMPKYGGDVVAVQEDTHALFRHLAADDDAVYWDYVTFGGDGQPRTQVRRQEVNGGAITTIAEGAFGIADGTVTDWLQAAGGYVYWLGSPAGATTATLERVPAAGGAREALLSYDDVNTAPEWVADASGIYTTNVPAVLGQADDCAVAVLQPPVQEPETLAACPTRDSIVVGTSADVVFLRASHGVWQASKRTPDLPVAALQTLPDDAYFYTFAFDETNVFANVYDATGTHWANFPKAGGAMTVFADRTVCPGTGTSRANASDPQYVYLLCGQYNQIVVVPKSAL